MRKLPEGKAISNAYWSDNVLLDWSDNVFSIKPKSWTGFKCPYPVISSLFRIFTICLICKYYENISKKATMNSILKYSNVPECMIDSVHLFIITFLIAGSKTELINVFLKLLFTTAFVCKKIDRTVYWHNWAYNLS